MPDVIVVGGGASAAAAAFQFADQGIRPLLLDVGLLPEAGDPPVTGNLYAHRRVADTFDLMIGDDFAGLANLLQVRHVPVKLNTPRMRYVTRDADVLGPVEAMNFSPIQSFAAGGLANAWGAGLYRYSAKDLEGFPLRADSLDPFYDRLTREIGIAGVEDDLAFSFGSGRDLLPPLPLSWNVGRLYRGYEKRRASLNREQFFLGRPRVAALTRPHDGRPQHRFENLEFWQESPSLYTPLLTLRKLIDQRKIDYRRGVLVESWSEDEAGIEVRGKDLAGGGGVTFRCRELVLAAGAINTARIALRSHADFRTRLPLLENPALQIPLILPASLGRRLDTEAFGLVQLNLAWNSSFYGCALQGSIMELTSPMRAEFFPSLPYSARANLDLLRVMLPAMLIMQLFFPGSIQEPNRLSLQEDGRLRIDGQPNRIDIAGAGKLLGLLRKTGAWSANSLIVRVPTGHAIHYAAALPMREVPGEYECHPDGRLQGTRAVYVADSASFSRLPAKNMSFGMMANAMRVAAGIATRRRETS